MSCDCFLFGVAATCGRQSPFIAPPPAASSEADNTAGSPQCPAYKRNVLQPWLCGDPGLRLPSRLVSEYLLLSKLFHGAYFLQFFHIQDRKSTRLNSSHANISYAVFCLKKKKNII